MATTLRLALLCVAALASPAVAQDVKALEKDLSDNDWDVVERATAGLLAMDSLEAGQALARGLGSERVYTRDWIFESWKTPPSEGTARWILTQGVADENVRVRRNLVELLGRWQLPDSAKVLEVLLTRDRDGSVRAEAARSLAALGATDSFDALARRVRSTEWVERIAVLESMAALDWAAAREEVEKATGDRNAFIHAGALTLLGEKDPAAALPAAIEGAKDSNWQVRAAAMAFLGRSKEKDAVQPLIDRLGAEAGRLKHDAWVALKRLTGKPIGDTAAMWQGWWDREKETFDLKAVIPLEEAQPGDGDAGGGSGIDYYGIVIYSNRLAFSLDCSGSMEEPASGGKTKLDVAKDELKKALGQFRPAMYFNMVFCPTVIQPWKDRLQPATPANLSAAFKFIDTRRGTGNEGGNRGNLYDSFVHSMLDPTTDTVFLLSDGVPTAGEYQLASRLVPHFERANRCARLEVHCVIIGNSSKGKKFMQDLARSTGGQHVLR